LAAGPEPIINAVVTLNSNHITSVNEMVNAAGIAALTGPQDIPVQKCAEFASRRDQVMTVMDAIPGVVCPRPHGAFYAFPDISCAFGKTHRPSGRTIGNDVDFCTALLEEKNVACIPGSAFGEPRSMRISYTCPTPQLQPGLDRIAELFSELT
jgi:aspartate aminotransferase